MTFSSFNYFMFDYFPGYKQVPVRQLCADYNFFAMPLLGLHGIEEIYLSNVSAALRRSC